MRLRERLDYDEEKLEFPSFARSQRLHPVAMHSTHTLVRGFSIRCVGCWKFVSFCHDFILTRFSSIMNAQLLTLYSN